MKKLGRKTTEEPLNYWQSTADMMSALLLILLLVIMLLLLYIIQIPDQELIDTAPGSYSTSVAGPASSEAGGWDGDEEDGGWNGPEEDAGHGGSGDGDEEDYPYEIPVTGGGGGGGSYPGDGMGEGNGKTAVYVMVIDSETEATIKEAGIRFELYTNDGGLQFLNTYYPRRVEYREYQTTSEGVFYLPEKVQLGDYLLRELNEPLGYDSAGTVAFAADEDRDWNEPLVVQIPLSPSKNIIRIRMIDADTGQPVVGGVYDVTAAEDIITQDGTLRYTAGQVVDQIRCDSSGYGESIELYLGEYQLTQSTVPQYYAADATPLEVSVEKKKPSVEAPLHQITCEKTTLVVQVSDELYPSQGLEGATFWLAREGGAGGVTISSDAGGQLVVTNLEKNTTYRLRQLTSRENYTFSEADLVFTVSSDGRIEEEVKKEYLIPNRILRVSVSVVDRVLQSMVSDCNVALYDSADQLVSVWDSTALAQSLEGLAAGNYTLVLDGKTQSPRHIQILDTAEVQQIRVPVWTLAGVCVLTAGLALAALLLFLFLRRRRSPRDPAPSRPVPVLTGAGAPAEEAPAPEPNAPAPPPEPAEPSAPETPEPPPEEAAPAPAPEPPAPPRQSPAEPPAETQPEPPAAPPEPAQPDPEPTASPTKYTYRAEKTRGRKPASHGRRRTSLWGKKPPAGEE